jgi:hypothetical protein
VPSPEITIPRLRRDRPQKHYQLPCRFSQPVEQHRAIRISVPADKCGIHLRLVWTRVDVVERELATQNLLCAQHYVTVPPDQVSHDVPRRPAINILEKEALVERSDRGRERFNAVLESIDLVFQGHDATPYSTDHKCCEENDPAETNAA